jgi:hypothetical protein
MPDDKKVDESWKEQAKSEQNPSTPKGADSPSPQAAGGSPSGPPPPDFPSLVASLAAGAFMALGGDPEGGAKGAAPDLDRARYAIDLLGMLAEKTKGNLTPLEERHITAALHELRMAYVEAARR